MRLRLLAAGVILALAVLFLVKAADRLWPTVLDSLPVARATAALLLAASLLLLLFFAVLRDGLRAGGRTTLAAAATIGMAGASIAVLVDLRGLLVTVSLARATREALAAASLGEMASAAALLWFFLLVHRRAPGRVRGTGLAIAGATVLAAVTLLLFAIELGGLGLDWLSRGASLPLLMVAAAALFGLAALVRFFVLLAADPTPLAGPA